MAFRSRKPLIYAEEVHHDGSDGTDLTTARSRRLSKPRTNGSSNNLSFNASIHQMVTARRSFNTMREDSSESLATFKRGDVSDKENVGDTDKLRETVRPVRPNGVSMMISKFENGYVDKNGSQSSLETQRPVKRPSSRPVATNASIVEQRSLQRLDVSDKLSIHSRTSPASSTEQMVGDPAPRPRRSPTFTPGVATRPSQAQDRNSEQARAGQDSTAIEPALEDNSRHGVAESTLDWIPPPRNNRPDTPLGLDYTHLGSHCLGTLTVTNGRASPAWSEAPKQLVTTKPRMRRDESSQYAPSEAGTIKFSGSDWVDETVSLEPSASLNHIVTEEAGSNNSLYTAARQPQSPLTEKLRQLSPIEMPPSSSHKLEDGLRSPDVAARLAQSYMDELPKTPYSEHSRSASPASYIHREDKAGGERSFLDHETLSSPMPSDDPSSPHPRDAISDPVGGVSPPLLTQESYMSFHSARERVQPEEEVFQSALELPSTQLKSPTRPGSSVGSRIGRPPVVEAVVARDSGYSSNTSLTPSAPVIPGTVSPGNRVTSPTKKNGFKMPFTRTSKDPQRAVLTNPSPSTRMSPVSSAQIETGSERTVPSRLSNLNDIVPVNSTTSLPASPDKAHDKQRKKLIKARRKSTVDIANDIIVGRLSSGELLDVPAVSPSARENLAARAELVPELDNTYKTHHHVRSQAHDSVLSLALALPIPRFPSPSREDDGRPARPVSRSRSRSRSFSRPRLTMRPKSWFGFGKESTKADHYTPVTLPPTHLDDLGDVLDSLGGNPYDVANVSGSRPSRSNSLRRVSPFNISNVNSRPRSMMDDETASNLSKLRRKSWHEKDRGRDKSPAFDERGGVLGKNVHTQESGPNVPPLPPMPSRDEIARRLSARYSYGINFHGRQHDPDALYSEPSSILDHAHSSEALGLSSSPPRPPSHSPRSSYVEGSFVGDESALPSSDAIEASFVYARNDVSANAKTGQPDDYDQYEPRSEGSPAPPPPSHSPRPIDITSSRPHTSRSRSPGPFVSSPSQLVHSPALPYNHKTIAYEEDWGAEAAQWSRNQPPGQYSNARQTDSYGAYPAIPPRRETPRNTVSYHNQTSHDSYGNGAVRSPYRSPYDQNPHHSYNGYNGYEQQHQHYPAQQQQQEYRPTPNPRHKIPRRPLPQQRHTVHEDFFARELDQQHLYHHRGYESAQQHSREMHNPYGGRSQQRPLQLQQRQQSPYRGEIHPAFRPQPHFSQDQQQGWNHYHQHAPVRDFQQQQQQHSYYPPRPARPSSRHSNMSAHSHRSLAEELHPDNLNHDKAANYDTAPQFGRYSGGFEYMGGSAGSRSVSGKQMANVGRKSFDDRERYGIDLDDIPPMTVGRGVEGRMVYT